VKLVPLGLVGISALVLALASASAGDARRPTVRGGCPRDVKRIGYLAPSAFVAATRAAKAQVPRVFRGVESQGTPATDLFEIQGVMLLLPQISLIPKISGLQHYYSDARRACGKRAASSTLLVLLYLGCQIPCSEAWAYATPTKRGWHVWSTWA
jgi:hypothetical protein